MPPLYTSRKHAVSKVACNNSMVQKTHVGLDTLGGPKQKVKSQIVIPSDTDTYILDVNRSPWVEPLIQSITSMHAQHEHMQPGRAT